jgi:hypothetical protein
MIAPKTSACRSIRQTVIDDDANGKIDDLVGIVGVRSGDVRRVDLKILVALATVMNGVLQANIDGPTGCRIAEMVQCPFPYFVPRRRSLAERTGAFFSEFASVVLS